MRHESLNDGVVSVMLVCGQGFIGNGLSRAYE
jgi:hypothetical protein